MRRLVPNRLRGQEGATMVMVAVTLPLLVLLTGLAVDTANWWVHKRHLQTQADAAALAGASAYRYPGCDDTAIEQEAVRFSGGRDPEQAGVEPEHNLMPDTTPLVPEHMHTFIQEPNFWGDEGVLDEDLSPGDPDRRPCEAKFIDVKMTEEDAPGFFARGWLPEIDAQARVSLYRLQTADGLLPIGVEDVNPVRVHVWMYDEQTGQQLGEAELRRHPTPENRVFIWDNALGNGDALPITVANVTARRIGLRVALSGREDTVSCTAQLVLCYGYGAPIPEDPGKFFDRGIGRVRGYDVSGNRPRLGEVALMRPDALAPTAPCGFNDALDLGYFAVSCSQIDITADLRGVTTTGPNAATVKAHIKDGNKEKSATLAWDATLGRWAGSLAVADTGPLPVRIEWEQTSGSLPDGTACIRGNKNPCKSAANDPELNDAHVHFAADRYFAGPIKHLRIDRVPQPDDPPGAGSVGIGNVERCAAGASPPCLESFVVRLGLGGRLELGEPSDPPISLRIFGGGSRNQSLDCDDDEPLFEEEIANGCRPSYTINTGQTCPSAATLWKSPEPWSCVAIQTGTAASKPAKGLNERVLCGLGHTDNCPQAGKATACTVRNAWPDYGVVGDDTRILALFLVPFGSFDSQGSGTVPVLDFAFFYITGWHGPGGFENPCQTEVPSYEDFVAGTENDQGVMSGHFLKPTMPNTGSGTGTEDCDVTTIGGCVAVLTK